MELRYNTKESILEGIKNLTTFNEMLDVRRQQFKAISSASHNFGSEFVVLGKWLLDRFGQVLQITRIQDGNYHDIKIHDTNILSLYEFNQILKPFNAFYTASFTGFKIPSENTRCACCNKYWTIHDIDDVTVQHNNIEMSELSIDILTEFKTKTDLTAIKIKQLTEKLNELTGWDWLPFIEEDGSVKEFSIDKYYHKACNLKVINNELKEKVNTIFFIAGIEVLGIVRTENTYGSESYRGDWLIVDTNLGHFKLGWRKRVIEVNYNMIDDKYTAITEHTVAPGMEHVYSYEDLIQALINFKLYLNNVHQLTNPKIPNLIKG